MLVRSVFSVLRSEYYAALSTRNNKGFSIYDCRMPVFKPVLSEVVGSKIEIRKSTICLFGVKND